MHIHVILLKINFRFIILFVIASLYWCGCVMMIIVYIFVLTSTGQTSPPLYVTYTPINSTALLLSWLPPNQDNSTILHCGIYLDGINIVNTTDVKSPLAISEGVYRLNVACITNSGKVSANGTTVYWLG